MKIDPKSLIIGMLLSLVVLAGCASTPWIWTTYAPSMPDSCYEEGKLLGPAPSDDLSMRVCQPDPITSPHPDLLKCRVIKAEDYEAMKADDLKCHNDLQICQAGPPPTR